MLITFVVSPGPPFVMIRMESNTLNVPVVMVIKIKNNWGDSIGRVILKNFLVPLAWSSIAASLISAGIVFNDASMINA